MNCNLIEANLVIMAIKAISTLRGHLPKIYKVVQVCYKYIKKKDWTISFDIKLTMIICLILTKMINKSTST